MVALVDDEDFEWLNQWKWHNCRGYAIRNSYTKPRFNIFMHREIMDCPAELQIDHIDGNGLNNQKLNLRVCVQSQNKLNHRKYRNNTLGYKGVTLNGGKIRACIQAGHKKTHIGYFQDVISAAKAYDSVAKELHGEFATLNFPNEV
jgi:hypothetical protein